MRIDQAVSCRKFDREVARLQSQEALLRSWGVHLQEIVFPNIQLLCVPRHRLILHLPVVMPGLAPNGQQVVQFQPVKCPSLAARAFGVHLSLEDFDIRPPSVSFVDPWNREPLKHEEMFRALHESAAGVTIEVLHAPHPSTDLPFLCMPGVREYHDHPQHSGNDWSLYRGGLSVCDLILTLWRTCMGTQAHLIAASPPQVLWNLAPSVAH